MKKSFPLEISNNAPARVVEAVKSEIRKYLKRERRKKLPEGVDFWDFDCKVGPTVEEARILHVAEINEAIDHALAEDWGTVYLEILATHGIRKKKPKAASEDSAESE
jgi:hypothetical protein